MGGRKYINDGRDTMLTVNEIAEKLKQLPERDVLEVLEIYSDEVVDRFMDKVEAKYDYLVEEFDEEEYEE